MAPKEEKTGGEKTGINAKWITRGETSSFAPLLGNPLRSPGLQMLLSSAMQETPNGLVSRKTLGFHLL